MDCFYNAKGSPDGKQRHCKECSRESCRKWSRENADKNRERAAKWYLSNREKALAYRRSRPEPKYNSAIKTRARNVFTHARRTGKIVKPDACTLCNVTTPKHKLHGHHEDYTKPLEVTWVCTRCHGLLHQRFKPDAMAVQYAQG